MGGGHVMPTGDALLSGMYLNELLLRLLARADPHLALFDAYAGVVRVLASEHGDALEAVLRSFELLLLREIGLLPGLDVQTMTFAPWSQAPATPWCPKAACVPRRPRTAQACWAASGGPCSMAWMTWPATPPPCVHVPPWRPNSSRSCVPCCNTIAAARRCARASS